MSNQSPILIPTVDRPIEGNIRIPGSKSITNRVLVTAALAKGQSTLSGMLHSVDTHYMTQAWKKLGAPIHESGEDLIVQGVDGVIQPCEEEIYIENAGTAARFLTSVLTLGNGNYTLTGNSRMQERPVQDLITALAQLNGVVIDLNKTGCPPVQIQANGLEGGTVSIPGNKSSQYISALMLTAPYSKKGITINIEGDLVSRTYIEMTIDVMKSFGAESEWKSDSQIWIPKGSYQGQDYHIEGDASSASYFFGIAAVTQGKVTVRGISKDSTQGDLGLVAILEEMGCIVEWGDNEVTVIGKPLKAIDIDMNTMSDVAPTLAVIALFAEGVTKIRNVANMRIKECDRITAVTTELQKLGAVAEEWEDGLAIHGKGNFHGAEIHTYDDHRMAMSFALAGLKIPDVKILDPDCVTKTFPNFFEMFLPLLNTK